MAGDERQERVAGVTADKTGMKKILIVSLSIIIRLSIACVCVPRQYNQHIGLLSLHPIYIREDERQPIDYAPINLQRHQIGLPFYLSLGNLLTQELGQDGFCSCISLRRQRRSHRPTTIASQHTSSQDNCGIIACSKQEKEERYYSGSCCKETSTLLLVWASIKTNSPTHPPFLFVPVPRSPPIEQTHGATQISASSDWQGRTYLDFQYFLGACVAT